MGESKRRKQLDRNYGKIYRLGSNALKTNVAEQVLSEMFDHFPNDLKNSIDTSVSIKLLPS